MEQRNLDAYVPDSNMARDLNLGVRCHTRAKTSAHRRMRAKLQSLGSRADRARRKAIVEPVFGVLKQQRGLRQFRARGVNNVENEFTVAAVAYNNTACPARRLKPKPRPSSGFKFTSPMQSERRSVLTRTLKPLRDP